MDEDVLCAREEEWMAHADNLKVQNAEHVRLITRCYQDRIVSLEAAAKQRGAP